RPRARHDPFAGLLLPLIEDTLALGIKIAEPIGLQPIGNDPEQEVAWQVRGRTVPANTQPLSPQRTDVEIAQARDLGIDCLSVRRGRTDLDPRHGVQNARALERRAGVLALSPPWPTTW